MKNLKVPFYLFFVSDEVNGVLEIHHSHEVASRALQDFREDGEAINLENGQEPDKALKSAIDFYSMEYARIDDMGGMLKILEDMGDNVGQYKLSILGYCVENGLLDEQQSRELYNEIK